MHTVEQAEREHQNKAYMLLVTGVARSGTTYIWKILHDAGLDIGRENRLGIDGIVSWEWAIEASQYPDWHVAGPQPEFDVILHQVRNPLLTINSFCTASIHQGAWEYLYRHIPIDPNAPLLQRAAEAWYHWSRKAQERASWTYQVETLIHNRKLFSKKAGIRELTSEEILKIPTNTNATPYKRPENTWKDIKAMTPLYKKIIELTHRYGYKT